MVPLTVLHGLSTFNRPGLHTLARGLPLRHPEAAWALCAVATSGAARAAAITPATVARRRVRILIWSLPGGRQRWADGAGYSPTIRGIPPIEEESEGGWAIRSLPFGLA